MRTCHQLMRFKATLQTEKTQKSRLPRFILETKTEEIKCSRGYVFVNQINRQNLSCIIMQKIQLAIPARYPSITYQVLCFLSFPEQFLIENQQSATDDIFGPCLYVDSKDDGALIKVTGCNETDERQNWAYTLKGQIQVCSLALRL